MFYGEGDPRSISIPSHLTIDVILGATESAPQADGAIPNGSRVMKIRSLSGDGHQDGARGVVRGSLGPIVNVITGISSFLYWVTWDDAPELLIGIVGDRIQDVTPKI